MEPPEQQLRACVEDAKEKIRQDVQRLLSEGQLQPILMTIVEGVNLNGIRWKSKCRKAMFDAIVRPDGLGRALTGRFTVIIDEALRTFEMQVREICEAVGSTTMDKLSPVLREVRERVSEEIQADFVAQLLKHLLIVGALVLGTGLIVVAGGAAALEGLALTAVASAAWPLALGALTVGGGVLAIQDLSWQEDDVRQSFTRELAEKLASQCDQQLLLQSLFVLLDDAAENFVAILQGRPPPPLPQLQPARAHDGGPADQTAWPAFESIVWHDPNISNDENQRYISKLRGQFPDLRTFGSFNEAEEYIRENALTSFTVLSSGSNGKELMEKIHECLNVERCYIFCRALEYHRSWAVGYKKILDVVVDIADVVRRLSEPPPSPRFAFYPVEQFWQHFNEVMRIYAHSQLNNCAEGLRMEDCVRHLVQVRNENPEHRSVTPDADVLLWSTWFSSPEAHYRKLLRLYTLEKPWVYGALNEAMRLKRRNRGLLMIMKLAEGLVAAMCEAVRLMPELKCDRMVFRGLKVSDDELTQIQQSRGKYVSLRSFTSTSTSRQVALNFFNFGSGPLNFFNFFNFFNFGSRPGRQVLMEIDCGAMPEGVQCTPPIFISRFSAIPSEEEVLFQPLACFEVLDVQEQADRTTVHMKFVAGMHEMPAAFMYAFM